MKKRGIGANCVDFMGVEDVMLDDEQNVENDLKKIMETLNSMDLGEAYRNEAEPKFDRIPGEGTPIIWN